MIMIMTMNIINYLKLEADQVVHHEAEDEDDQLTNSRYDMTLMKRSRLKVIHSCCGGRSLSFDILISKPSILLQFTGTDWHHTFQNEENKKWPTPPHVLEAVDLCESIHSTTQPLQRCTIEQLGVALQY